jgi:hypothetical protein
MAGLKQSLLHWRRAAISIALVLLVHAWLLAGFGTVWHTTSGMGASLRARVLPAPKAAPTAVPTAAPATVAQPKPEVPVIKPKPPVVQKNTAQAAIKNEAEKLPELEQAVVSSTATATVTTATAEATSTEPLTPQPTASNSSEPTVADSPQLEFPAAMQLEYLVSDNKDGRLTQITGNLEWTSDGSSYRMRLSATKLLVTVIDQTSEGLMGEGGLRPVRFADKRINRSEQAVHFVREEGRIIFSNNNPEASLQPGTQDRLSMLMQLSAMALGNPARFAQGSTVIMPVASADEASPWQWESLGQETMTLPVGPTKVLHLQRQPRTEFDAKLELWLASDYSYLPVRILRTERNGNLQDLQLQSQINLPAPVATKPAVLP